MKNVGMGYADPMEIKFQGKEPRGGLMILECFFDPLFLCLFEALTCHHGPDTSSLLSSPTLHECMHGLITQTISALISSAVLGVDHHTVTQCPSHAPRNPLLFLRIPCPPHTAIHMIMLHRKPCYRPKTQGFELPANRYDQACNFVLRLVL